MSKKVYLILFYISLVLTSIIEYIYCKKSYDGELSLLPYAFISIAIIVIIGIILTILFIKKNFKASIACPVIYLVFLISVCILTNHYFSNIIFNAYMFYYSNIILIGLMFLIVYTCLCFSKKDKVLKKTK